MPDINCHATKAEADSRLKKVDILLMVVNDNEYNGVLRQLSNENDVIEVERSDIPLLVYKHGGHEIAIVRQPTSGKEAAKEWVKFALDVVKPKKIISVGVTCGNSSKQQDLGDILVCKMTADYSTSKIDKNGKIIGRGQTLKADD